MNRVGSGQPIPSTGGRGTGTYVKCGVGPISPDTDSACNRNTEPSTQPVASIEPSTVNSMAVMGLLCGFNTSRLHPSKENPHTSTQELIYRHREWGGGVVRRESARNQKKMAKEAGWQVKCIPPTTNNNNNNKLA